MTVSTSVCLVHTWLTQENNEHIRSLHGSILQRSTGGIRAEVRPHHAAHRTPALARGGRADRVQAGRPGVTTNAYTRQLRRTSLRNSTSHLLTRPSHQCLGSALTSLFVVRCTYPYFNRRRSSFSGRRFPTVEHSALAERHVTDCF